MKVLIGLFTVILCVIMCGCATNGYAKYYQAYSISDQHKKQLIYLLGDDEPEVVSVSSSRYGEAVKSYISDGYRMVGRSSFNGKEPSSNELAIQAKKVGATLVVSSHLYTDTNTQSGVVFIPSVFHGNYFYGSTAVPYSQSVRRYDFYAAYLVKSKSRPSVGLWVEGLTSKQKQEVKSNYGVSVIVVVGDSPAGEAGVLPGDILLKINDVIIKNVTQFFEYGSRLNDCKSFKVYRDGKAIDLVVK